MIRLLCNSFHYYGFEGLGVAVFVMYVDPKTSPSKEANYVCFQEPGAPALRVAWSPNNGTSISVIPHKIK